MNDPIVVVSAARTPLGVFQGMFAGVPAPQLGAVAIAATAERAGLPRESIDELIMGCVLPAGLGQAPARQAALAAGLPHACACTTINKVCGSGMKALMFAHDLLRAGSATVVVAGGMESMSNAPYLLPKARAGYRLGHGQLIDHMFLDGLEDAYSDRGALMGSFAEDCAQAYGFTREQQDAFALASLTRARLADAEGRFAWEIAPVAAVARKGGSEAPVVRDEQPQTATPDKIPRLKPAFRADGTVTAANSSSISDGAAALMLTRRSTAERLGLPILAAIRAHATYAGEPRLFPSAPVGAIRRVLERTAWRAGDVDLYEINEAFAVVAMAAMHDLDLPHERVNVHGGACALGHPLGASGARILVTLIGALRRHGLRRGVASLCIGGGEATAVAIELDAAQAT
jgi:acetyl-CoA C-acetyltransferase